MKAQDARALTNAALQRQADLIRLEQENILGQIADVANTGESSLTLVFRGDRGLGTARQVSRELRSREFKCRLSTLRPPIDPREQGEDSISTLIIEW